MKSENVRIQLDVSTDVESSLDLITDQLGYKSRRETFTTAIALLEWAANEVAQGRKIGAIENDKRYVEVLIPAFSRLGKGKPAKVKESATSEARLQPGIAVTS